MNGLVNFSAFQLLWFSIVWGAARGLDWLGLALLLAWLPLHLRLSQTARSDLSLFFMLGLLGPVLDTALIQAELVQFQGMGPFRGYAPFWMMALWANFALTLNHSLHWISRNTALATAFGALGGPLAYYAGARMGAAELAEPVWRPLLALAILWGITLAILGLFVRDDEARDAI